MLFAEDVSPIGSGGVAALVAALVSVGMAVASKALEAAARWRRSSHHAKVQQHEMTVRLKVSEEYEKIILQLRGQLQEIDAELHRLADQNRKCEAENLELRRRVSELEFKLSRLEGSR